MTERLDSRMTPAPQPAPRASVPAGARGGSRRTTRRVVVVVVAALLLSALGLAALGRAGLGPLASTAERGPAGATADAPPVAQLPRARLTIEGTTLDVALALNAASRRRGLMRVRALAPGEGMLFVYPAPRRVRFWMKDTPVGLDIAFIDAGGRIVAIHTRAPLDTQARGPGVPVAYVLEVQAGWCAAHGVGVGANVRLPNGLTARAQPSRARSEESASPK